MEVTTHKVRIDLLPCVSQKRQKPAPLELCESEKKKREPLALCRSEKTKTGKTPCRGWGCALLSGFRFGLIRASS